MKVFWKQKLLSGVLAATMAASAISGGMVAVSAAEELSSGTPYAAGGTFLENSFEEHAPLTMERLSSIQIGEPNPDGL